MDLRSPNPHSAASHDYYNKATSDSSLDLQRSSLGELDMHAVRYVVLITFVGFLSATAWAQATAATRVAFRIDEQPVRKALRQWAEQTGLQVVFSDVGSRLDEKTAQPVSGELAPEAALQKMLAKTDLSYEFVTERVVRISTAADDGHESKQKETGGEEKPTSMAGEEAARAIRLAQADVTSGATATAGAVKAAANKEISDEVVITGSHIRGAQTTSPTLTFTQVDFERAGAATAQQFLATLPQNFGGGQTDYTTNEPGRLFNPAFGTAVNLRGLGPSSTLVLINGRRSAVAGLAEFVDISMIPLAAVERIEIMTDGASAIYGSDAIGGVVNFIMRKNYAGAETGLRGGATTHGDGQEYQVTHTQGMQWGSGGATAALEYHRRDSINAVDRAFSRTALGPYDLVPRQEKYGAYISAHQQLTSRLQLSGDVIFSDRVADNQNFNVATDQIVELNSDTKQYGASASLAFELSQSWQIELVGGASQNETDYSSFIPELPNTPPRHQLSEYSLWSADLKAAGNLFTLPAGPVRTAIGAGFRDESYEAKDDSVIRPRTRFDVLAAYAELEIPLLGPKSPTSDAARLILSAAGRYEEHSSFGSTFDPKFGLSWKPVEALRFRGTYGTSFKAPSLYQLNDFNGTYNLINRADPQSPMGTVRAINLAGNNPDLQEETATAWTIGVDFTPQAIPALRAAITFFDIEYEDRIENAAFVAPLSRVLTDQRFAGLVTRRGQIPDAEFNARVTELLSGRVPTTGCSVPVNPTTRACGEPVTNFGAILDRRLRNLTVTHARGFDLQIEHRFAFSASQLQLSFNGSYLFDHERQVTVNDPVLEFVDTTGNPIDLRIRASGSWIVGGWTLGVTGNYSDKYSNERVTPTAEMSSWTTVDAQIRYDTSVHFQNEWFGGTSVSLLMRNLFDRDPPFMAGNAAGLGYDPSNADPLGRNISLLLKKEW